MIELLQTEEKNEQQIQNKWSWKSPKYLMGLGQRTEIDDQVKTAPFIQSNIKTDTVTRCRFSGCDDMLVCVVLYCY